MTRVLTVPNWSFSEPLFIEEFSRILKRFGVTNHFLEGDLDHNRTVSAFSGDLDEVFAALQELVKFAFLKIDINTHQGVHPRHGVLDVCPFIIDSSLDFELAEKKIEAFSKYLCDNYNLPIFLYEQSAKRANRTLPEIRSLMHNMPFQSDYGPTHPHSRLGVSILGIRRFLIALNCNFDTEDLQVAQEITSQLRRERDQNSFLSGVRILAFPLKSKDMVQVSLTITQPDLTPIDSIIGRIGQIASQLKCSTFEPELIGVIRDIYLPTATSIKIKERQIYKTKHN